MAEKMATMFDRRRFLDFSATGLSGAALFSLLGQEQSAMAAVAKKSPHPIAKAKRAIHICLVGGFSQVDSFDYKTTLEKLHGKSLPGDAKPDTFFGSAGLLRKSEWKFRQRGKSGRNGSPFRARSGSAGLPFRRSNRSGSTGQAATTPSAESALEDGLSVRRPAASRISVTE